MRVAYGDSNVLRCNVQFAYDRFFTSFDGLEGAAPINTTRGVVNSKDINKNYGITDDFYSSKKTKEKRTLQTQGGKYQLGDGAGFL